MKRLWWFFIGVNLISFTILGLVGREIYRHAPPIPDRVVTADGRLVVGPGEIAAGQNVWQSIGGMEIGSVWGHGSYVAPDWTSDWLHREILAVLGAHAQADFKTSYETLDGERQAFLRARVEKLYRENRYDPDAKTLTVSAERANAFEKNVAHFSDVFSKGRAAYAIPAGALSDPNKLRQIAAFFFWTSWAASANRPGGAASYTNNWPHEPLIANRPTGPAIFWSGLSVILLLAGIGAMVAFYAKTHRSDEARAPAKDPLLGLKLTPSQKVSLAYFGVAAALILVQVAVGIVTAHYGVEGDGFYGLPLSRWLPYVVTRTWHVQLGLFWIATSWLAAGLFIGPIVAGGEPKGQAAGVAVLLGALVVIVVGSLAGEWASVFHKFTGESSFYWGHQGYEYVDLGRIWQIGLFAGLLIWLVLLARCIVPALQNPRTPDRPLLTIFFVSAVAIGCFYGAGLAWGAHTPLSIVEYWRWWVVHLWVEGFFEVFATAVIAFLFSRMGLVGADPAAKAVLFSSTIYLAGGIIGTLHHLYFAGTPTAVLALGAVFSALEVVPLTLMGYEAWDHIRVGASAPWMSAQYKWPIRFFVAVAFWNMIGAGLFGFAINPPIALYYMQGLNTTPLHGHAALFGVYGMLGIGLMLFCLRAVRPGAVWRDIPLQAAFWGMNAGLALMCALSLLPIGIAQTLASVETGYWYARSAEFLQSPTIMFLRWLRVPGDALFALGALALVAFIAGLATGHSYKTLPPLPAELEPREESIELV